MPSSQLTISSADLEAIERSLYKMSDDLAVSIARSFERLEERIDASEARLSKRIADIEALLAQEDF
jgi:hypothetical protein